jgi:chromosome segregation ATPase
MARGKHAIRAEAQSFDRIEAEVAELKMALTEAKADLSGERKEVRRLQAVEALFSQTKHLIVEVERLKKELTDVGAKNLVLNERLERWAEVLIADRNKEVVALNRDMWADLCEMGYVPDEFKTSRAARRNTRSGHAARKIFKMHQELEKAGVKIAKV